MSTDKLVTKSDLQDFYSRILPYLGGMPEMLANKFSKGDLYSTDEKMIGQWIDGKPLYSKTISCGAMPNSTKISIAHGISNIDKIVHSEVFEFNETSGAYTALNSVYFNSESTATIKDVNNTNRLVSVDGYNYFAYIDRTYIYLSANSERDSYNAYATIKYTKTTDSAISIGSDTDYSTTEKVVGTWIDGKPLYQKTFVTEAPTVVTQGTEVHEFIDIGASVEYSSLVSVENDAGVATTNTALKFWVDESTTPKSATPIWYVTLFNNTHATTSYQNKIRLSASDTGTNGHTFYITIQYTKTTD